MKCHAVSAWLLVSRAGGPLPKEIARHLRSCRKCRCRRRRLLRLDEEMNQAPAPTVDPATKGRLFQQLDPRGLAAPDSSALAPPRGHRRKVNWLTLASAAAALLLGLGLGWMLFGPRDSPREEGPSLPHPSLRAGRVDDRLVGRLVEHHLGLAGAHDPAEQLALLNSMADDLRGEAFRLAGQASPEELPLVTGLYERVLREGLAPQAWSLPAEQRQQLLPPLARKLRQTESEVEQAARESPFLIADLLRPMGTAAREVSGMLLTDREPIPLPGQGRSLLTSDGLGTSHTVLVALVAQSLFLAGENDSLRRAYYCNDVADHLALAVQMASARGDTEQATRLGKYLGDIMDRGVNANLNRVRKEEPDDPRLAELARVIQRAARAVEALEKDLAINPGQTQASRYGHAKDLERALKELEKALREATREKKDGPKKPPKDKDGPKKPPPKEKVGPGKPPPKDHDIKGVVKSVDGGKGIIVLEVKEKGEEIDRTLQLPADIKVRVGLQEGTLIDVKPGQEVKVRLRDVTTVEELKVEGKDK